MAIRNDISIRWDLSPRLVIIDAPSNEISMQDLIDTLRYLESLPNGIDELSILKSSGKENLGGGITVGLTVELQNAYVYFEARSTVEHSGIADNTDPTGTILIDASQNFEGSLAAGAGEIVFNSDTGGMATVVRNISSTELESLPLTGGTRNDWITGDNYVIYHSELCLTSGGNLVAVDSSENAIYPLLPSPNVQATLTSASSATSTDLEAIQYSSYQNAVWVDANTTTSGIEYPSGTREFPVNNISDAIDIANTRGFDTIGLLTDIVINNNNILNGFHLRGKSHVDTHIFIYESAEVENIKISDCHVSGTLDGGTELNDCIAEDINYVNGHLHDSGIIGSLILDGNEDAVITNCRTIDLTNTPVIDLNTGGQNLVMTDYTGRFTLKNNSDPSTLIGVALNGGAIILDPTLTAGSIGISGIGTLMDYSNGIIVTTTGLMSKDTIAEAVGAEIGTEIQYSTFGEGVWVDTIDGSAGTEYPIGTPLSPVNNLDDAKIIAESYGFKKLQFLHDYTFLSNTYLVDYEVCGRGMQQTTFTFESGSTLPYSKVCDAIATGIETGLIGFSNVNINNLSSVGLVPSSVDIIVSKCLLSGSTEIPSNYTGTIKVLDSWSNIPGSETPVLNMGDASANLFFRNYSGGIKIDNFSQSENRGSIDLTSGQVKLANTVTAGYITVRGVGYITDDSSGATINVNGLMSKATIADAVGVEIGTEIEFAAFQNKVAIDVLNGSIGTDYPLGTIVFPVNNTDDAKIIAQSRGLGTLLIIGDIILTDGDDVDNFNISGQDVLKSNITIESSANVQNCIFTNARVEGVLDGNNIIQQSRIGDISYFNGYMKDCAIEGEITLGGGVNATIANCFRGDMNNIGVPPSINMGGSGQQLGLRNYTGGIAITNMNDLSSKVSIDLLSGKVVLDETIKGGLLVIRGVGQLFDDSSTNGTLEMQIDGLMNKDIVAEAVLNNNLATFNTPYTVGTAFQLSAYDNKIWVDENSIEIGTSYPAGTFSNPVNNVMTAQVIANSLNIKTIKINGDYTFINGDYLDNFTIVGDGQQQTHLNFEAGSILLSCRIESSELTGSIIGTEGFSNCHIIGLISDTPYVSDRELLIQNCILEGNIQIPALYGGQIQVLDSWAMPDASGAYPVFNVNDSSCSVQIRNFSGFITFDNVTQSNDVRVSFASGGAALLPTVTNGHFRFSGIGSVQNYGTPASLYEHSLISQSSISTAVWDEQMVNHTEYGSSGKNFLDLSYSGFIHIDTVDGSTGTIFPVGTFGLPVNNITDALTLASNYNISNFKIKGNLTIDQPIAGFSFFNWAKGELILACNSCDHSYFDGLKISGNQVNGATFNNCEITNLQNLSGAFRSCYFIDTTPMLLSGDQLLIDNCRSGVAGTDSPIFDASNGNIDLSMRAYSGGIRFINYNDPSNLTTVEFVAGKLNLEPSDTAGFISARGVYALNLNGATLDLDTSGRAGSAEDTAEAVWTQDVSGYINPNSAGNTLWTNAKKTVNKIIPFLFAK